VIDRINYVWYRDATGELIFLLLMTYGPLGLRPTHDISNLGLSALVIYRTCNTTSHAKIQATKARGRHDTKMVMMVPELFAAHAVSLKEHR
jgi:hypothetical protein